MKATIEVVPLTHHNLTQQRVIAALHEAAQEIAARDSMQDAGEVTFHNRHDLVRVTVTA